MADTATITAELREASGTGAARAFRRSGKTPGIVYGSNVENLKISIDHDDLFREVHQQGFFSQLYTLKVGPRRMNVIARDLQVHPVTDAILHVDFLAVAADSTVAVNVPVVFVNEEDCTGLARGGVLNIVRHEVELNCPVNSIPASITIDLSGLDIGDSIHINSVSLPDDVVPVIDDRDFTIATIAPPTVSTDVVQEEDMEDEELVSEVDEEV